MATLIKVGSKWYSDLRMGGRRIKRALSTDKRIAQRMLDEMVALRHAERHGETPKNVSWEFFKTRYHEYCGANKSRQTTYRDELAFRMLEEQFPITRLDQISPELLERLKFKWTAPCQKCEGCRNKKNCEKVKTDSVWSRAIRSLKTAMRKAEAWKYIAPQVWLTVKIREPKSRLLYYSMAELENLLCVCRAAGTHWLTFALLGARAGLRRGESFHLDFGDIDFSRREIWIHEKPCSECRSCIDRGNLWKPKGAKERRVRMPPDLQGYLESMPVRSGFVLGDDRFTIGTADTFFRRLVRRAGLKGSAHTLRHTFASHLVSSGASLEAVGELLGHGDPKTTKIYAHLMPHVAEQTIAKLPPLSSGLIPMPAGQGILKVI